MRKRLLSYWAAIGAAVLLSACAVNVDGSRNANAAGISGSSVTAYGVIDGGVTIAK